MHLVITPVAVVFFAIFPLANTKSREFMVVNVSYVCASIAICVLTWTYSLPVFELALVHFKVSAIVPFFYTFTMWSILFPRTRITRSFSMRSVVSTLSTGLIVVPSSFVHVSVRMFEYTVVAIRYTIVPLTYKHSVANFSSLGMRILHFFIIIFLIFDIHFFITKNHCSFTVAKPALPLPLVDIFPYFAKFI